MPGDKGFDKLSLSGVGGAFLGGWRMLIWAQIGQGGNLYMLDVVDIFRRQFTPFEGGYLVYPARQGGGKFVTTDEYERLVADWSRVAGRSGILKIVGVTCVTIVLWVILQDALSLPEWARSSFVVFAIFAIFAWVMWASMSPGRLVKDRAAVVPPRPRPEARREARAVLTWPLVAWVLTLSGAAFLGSVSTFEHSPSGWGWLIGSGLIFAIYVWVAIKKAFDVKH